MWNKTNSPFYYIKVVIAIVYAILFTICLPSCNNDDEGKSRRTGTFLLSLTTDTAYQKTTTTKAIAYEFADFLNVNEYTVNIIQEGEVFRSYSRYADMPDEIEIPSGTYTLQAYKGENKAGAFLNPYFEGNQDFSIEEGMRTPISTTCTLANTRVTVSYTNEFMDAYPSHAVHFSTDYMNTDSLTFAKGESRAAYFRSDKNGTDLNLILELVKLEETTVNYYKPDPISIEPRQNVNLLFKTDGEAINGIGLVVTLNNNWEDTVTFNMTIPEYAWGDVKVPTLGKENFEKTIENISYRDLRKKEEFYYLDYIAPASVGKTILTINRIEDGNITSSEYDLATTEGANAARLLGVTISDQANEKTFSTTKESKYGRIHFADALALLAPSKKNIVYTYSVQVTDALPVNPNSTETATFTVKPNGVKDSKIFARVFDETILATHTLSDSLTIDFDSEAGIKTANLEIKRNGIVIKSVNILSDILPEGITLANDRLSFNKAFVQNLEVAPGVDEKYTYTLKAIDQVDEEFIDSPVSFTITLKPLIEITIPEEFIWGWKAKAVIYISGFSEQHKSDLNVYIKRKGGAELKPLSGLSFNNSTITVAIPDLTVDSEYELIATFKDIEKTYLLKTEKNIQVENSNMDTWFLSRTTCKYSFLGMQIQLQIPFPYLNSSAQDGYWKTNNSETAGQEYSASSSRDIPKGCFPTVVYEDRGDANKFAAIIRSIDASDKNDKARGELVYENAIGSRPYSISFEYIYEPVDNESFISDIIVYAGEKEIGRGHRPTSANARSTYEKCTIPINYDPDTELKATRIKILFASTDKTDFGTNTIQTFRAPDPSSVALVSYPGKFKNFSGGVNAGSTLKIDNVILNYAEE